MSLLVMMLCGGDVYKILMILTPDFKDQKIETEATKTCNISFLSLKHPDFKYVIFKIVEVS